MSFFSRDDDAAVDASLPRSTWAPVWERTTTSSAPAWPPTASSLETTSPSVELSEYADVDDWLVGAISVVLTSILFVVSYIVKRWVMDELDVKVFAFL